MPSPDTIYYFALVLSFTLLLMSFAKPIYGVLAYLLVMMTRLGLHFALLEQMRIELIFALIVIAEAYLTNKDWAQKIRFDYNPVNRYLFFFLLVILFSFAQAWDYAESWNYVVIEFLRIYALFLMMLVLIKNEKDLKMTLWIYSIATIILGYEGIYFYVLGRASYVFQGVDVAIASKGFASGHVAAANMQLQGLPIMFYLIIIEKKAWLRGAAVLLSLLSVLGVIASGSRGGFLGLIVFALLGVYFSQKKGIAILTCLIIFLVMIPLLSETYLSWMESVVQHSDDSAMSRISGLTNGIEMMFHRPLLGVGPGCYPLARKAWFGWGLESHNHYGQLMGDLGLMGTIAWIFFITGVFKNLKKAKELFLDSNKRALVLIVTSIQIALLVRLFEGMFSHSLYIFFWYIMAVLSIVLVKIPLQETTS